MRLTTDNPFDQLEEFMGHLQAGHPEDEPVRLCCECGNVAICYYMDDECLPSCGNPACEVQMQAAYDYNQEAGDR